MKKLLAILILLSTAALLKAEEPAGAPAPALKMKVRLIRDNITVDSLLTSPGRPFCFFLKMNGNYTLSVSSEGQPPRLLRVSTAFSGRSPRRSYYRFQPQQAAASAATEEQAVFDEATGSFLFNY